jgi:hypothetical protein
MTTRSMISFDWAMKRLLRQKANFEVLEGFLSVLLRRKIIIKHIGESESNPTEQDSKTNRVDILVEADDHELVIIELQYNDQIDYFQRMLFGVSKAITDHIYKGEPYANVRKVYSVNIVYFELGQGDDYVYHGYNSFKGLHTNNELQLNDEQRKFCGKDFPWELFPEYYIILVRGFDDIAKDTLDEWIYYLKHNKIRDDFTAQGLDKAREVLAFDNLSDAEKQAYWRSIDADRIKLSEIETAMFKGEFKVIREIARKMLADNVSVENICRYTGLPVEQIEKLQSVSDILRNMEDE